MMKKLLPAILVTMLALVLVGIKVYPVIKEKMSANEPAPATYDESAGTKEKPAHRKPWLEESFPFTTKEEEDLAKKYPGHFQIVEKMYYSWDFIENAYSSFQYLLNGDLMQIEFHIDLLKKKSLVKKEQDNGRNQLHHLVKDGVITVIKPNERVYTQQPAEYPEEGLSSFADEILNSEWQVMIWHNYSNWSYKEGKQFGMPVYFIEGKIPTSTSNALAGPFTMTVSKETGALLDLKCYGNSDKPIMSVDLKEIKINQGIPEDIFTMDLSGYKEVSEIEKTEKKTGGVKTSDD